MIKTPKFGDIVENGWASEDNPTRRGYFVRAYTTTGRMNRGLHWQITDKRGKFWDLQPKVIGDRLTVTPEPTPEPVAWAKPGFIYDRDGYSIGTDEPEVRWGPTCPEDEPGYWAPLFSSAIRQQVGGGEDQAEQIAETAHCSEIAAFLVEQYDEPLAADLGARMNYWRDKCITAGQRLGPKRWVR